MDDGSSVCPPYSVVGFSGGLHGDDLWMYNSSQIMFMGLYVYFDHVVWFFYYVSLVWELVIVTRYHLRSYTVL